MSNRHRYGVVAILLLAGVFRLYRAGYGTAEPCLALPEEYWLYDDPQVSSIYAWDQRLPGAGYTAPVETPRDALTRTVAPSANDLAILRLVGTLTGLVTVAMTVRFARRVGANWSIPAGLFVACAPWFVTADKWVLRFDLATLAVAVSALLLRRSYNRPQQGRRNTLVVGGQVLTAISLLLIAPPLWWLAIGLLLLQPQSGWRWAATGLLIGLVTIPALQSPWLWLEAARMWDTGATAACVWGLLALCLWRWPQISHWLWTGIAIAALVLGGSISVLSTAHLPSPDNREWALIHWLQDRLPDDAVVRFDASTWYLAPIVSCPKAVNRRFIPQQERVEMPFLAGPRPEQLAANFVVSSQEQKPGETFYVYHVEDFYVGRMTPLPNATDIQFGDVLHILGYQLATPKARPGDLIDVRLDYQFSPSVNVDTLRYAAFIQVFGPNSLTNRIINYNVPFVAESGNFGPRRLVLNQHFRLPLPADAAPGTYEVVFGLYNMYTGERLNSERGNILEIGQLEITGLPVLIQFPSPLWSSLPLTAANLRTRHLRP